MKDVRVGQRFFVDGRVMRVTHKRVGSEGLGLFRSPEGEVTLVLSDEDGPRAMCVAGLGELPSGFVPASGDLGGE